MYKYKMTKINISIDDVLILTQMMGKMINTKRLQREEFERVKEPWERLTDSLSKLQRSKTLEQLYPPEKPESKTQSDTTSITTNNSGVPVVPKVDSVDEKCDNNDNVNNNDNDNVDINDNVNDDKTPDLSY